MAKVMTFKQVGMSHSRLLLYLLTSMGCESPELPGRCNR